MTKGEAKGKQKGDGMKEICHEGDMM